MTHDTNVQFLSQDYHFHSPASATYSPSMLVSFSGVTIMLAITIFSTIIGDMLPVSENSPLIGQQHFNFAFRKFNSDFVVEDFHQKLGQNPYHLAINMPACLLINFCHF